MTEPEFRDLLGRIGDIAGKPAKKLDDQLHPDLAPVEVEVAVSEVTFQGRTLGFLATVHDSVAKAGEVVFQMPKILCAGHTREDAKNRVVSIVQSVIATVYSKLRESDDPVEQSKAASMEEL